MVSKVAFNGKPLGRNARSAPVTSVRFLETLSPFPSLAETDALACHLSGAQPWGGTRHVCLPGCRLCPVWSLAQEKALEPEQQTMMGQIAATQTAWSPVVALAGGVGQAERDAERCQGCGQGCPTEVTVVGEIGLLWGFLLFSF